MVDSKLKVTNPAIGRIKITLVVVLAAMIIYLFIALFSFSINDTGWSSTSSEVMTQNYAGPVGAYISGFILSVFGVVGFVIPFLLIDFIRILLLNIREKKISYIMSLVKITGVVVLILSCCGLSELYLSFANYWVPQRSGGIIGYESAKFVIKNLGMFGGSFALLIGIFAGLTLYCGTVWLNIMKSIASFISALILLLYIH